MTTVSRVLRAVSAFCARPVATLISVLLVLLWAIAGPFAHYSDGWQLVLNTGTSIVTFVLLFVIIYGQARDTSIIMTHLKAQTLAAEGVDDKLVHLDKKDDADVEGAHAELEEKAKP